MGQSIRGYLLPSKSASPMPTMMMDRGSEAAYTQWIEHSY